MENCKFCQAEMEENSTVCPGCGKDNAEPETDTQEVIAEETAEVAPAAEASETEIPAAEVPEAPKAEIKDGIRVSPGMLAGMIAAFVVLLAVLIAVIAMGLKGNGDAVSTDPTASGDETVATEETVPATTPADTGLNDVSNKGTYTVSDEDAAAAADTVVATIGDQKLTNAELQIYYWMGINGFLNENYYYLSMYGLDYTQPLDMQVCAYTEEGTSWQHFFLGMALENWQLYEALYLESVETGFVLSDEQQAELDNMANTETFEQEAVNAGFASGQEYLEYFVGKGSSIESYLNFLRHNYIADAYYRSLTDQLTYTDEEIETYFNENEETLSASGITRDAYTVDVRHILVFPEGATSETIRTETFPDEAWAAAETEAKQILDDWLAGEKTEESFGVLANEKSDDGDGTGGGLYEGVEPGMMVEAFDAWCFDAARQVGDYDIVKTEFGYHVMYFSGSDILWPSQTESFMISEASGKILENAVSEHPVEADYSAMVLGFVDMNG